VRNPGLDTFAAVYTHPRLEDIRRGDPDFDPDEEEGEGSDWVPFSGWRREPGQPLRVAPGVVGKPLTVDQAKDVIHGEVISPEEQDAADRIIHGEHESGQPSANPDVAAAQSDLHTEDSDNAVRTLSDLLAGAHPSTMRPEDLDAAHKYLNRHWSGGGLTVNPERGHLVASSPAGTQVAVRKVHLPAIPTEPVKTTYKLTNKHGTMESDDPERIMRAMVAFQIVHTAAMQQQQQKDDDDQNQTGLTSTSGLFRDLINRGLDRLDEAMAPREAPLSERIPPTARFFPGQGTHTGPGGVQGGYMMKASDPDFPGAAAGWTTHGGMGYSPLHWRSEQLDPKRARVPFEDPRYPGNHITYMKNTDTGNVHERNNGGTTYWADDFHPAVIENSDVPQHVKSVPAARMPKRPPTVPRHPRPPSGGGQITSSAEVNDLCPVCASGYLEPHDANYHECLNCGSLVKQLEQSPAPRTRRERKREAEKPDWFFDKFSAARPKGGLGRGLKQIQPYEGDPLGLADDERNSEDHPQGGYVHPLAGEQPPEDYEEYVAPRRILDKEAGSDPIEEFLGKQGFSPVHKPGQSRAYIHPIPGVKGAFFRVTEGVPLHSGGPSGWQLTADNTNKPEPQSFKVMTPGRTVDRKMPDVGDRAMPEKSMLAGGSHPIEDDTLNRAIRDVHENGRNAEVYRKLFETTAYEPPSLEPRGSTQRAKRMLSSTNPGLTVFADWDTSEVNPDPCTHCSGSGVDPEYGDQCLMCEGSGTQPDD